jgi:hypothetical protein
VYLILVKTGPIKSFSQKTILPTKVKCTLLKLVFDLFKEQQFLFHSRINVYFFKTEKSKIYRSNHSIFRKTVFFINRPWLRKNTKLVDAAVYLVSEMFNRQDYTEYGSTTLLLGAFYTYPLGGFPPYYFVDLHRIKLAP